MKIAKSLLNCINGVLSIDNKKASRYKKHDTIIDKTYISYDEGTNEFAIVGITSEKEIVYLRYVLAFDCGNYLPCNI